MNLKDIIEIEITDNGMNGEGVARYDGKVVFVPFTLKGERVKAMVGKVGKNMVQASVIKVLLPSTHRVKPSCPHYYKCGGCDTEHLSETFRREALINELKNNFKKIAGLDITPSDFISCEGSKRNKLSMPFGYVDGKVVLGMYKQNSHEVIPVDCLMAGERTRQAVGAVLTVCNAEKLSVYDERSGKGLLRHLVVREIANCERLSVTVVVNGDGLGKTAEDKLCKALDDNVDLFVCENRKRNNVIMGDTVRLIKGEPRLNINVLGVKAELSPLSFFQVNDAVRDKLYSYAIDNIRSKSLIDLYSGIGITSNLAAAKVNNVVAVECVPQATADADRTAELNGNSHRIKNVCGDVETVLPRIAGELIDADILVDPPRKGCGAAVMATIARAATGRLIYISCNHATMCRDVRVFIDEAKACGKAYEVCECKLFDMFPGTHHVETVCILEKH
ncbi:MAG: 23S rRNA (uracil(1939)-C(5))-methyltransferase RlmD [Clostridiales bacterium]|nr:23S rRNA (uracil(1939)-C(5))-methyltransferase RlmD [Clostridiales bacterium]